MKQKTQQQLQDQVDRFNNAHPVGSTVNLKMDCGEVKLVTICNKATVLSGHSAVGWFSEVSGCYLLDRIKKPKTSYPF